MRAFSLIISLMICASTHAADQGPLLVDSIVATVNDSPITLRELQRRLNPPRSLTLSQAATDAEAKQVLDALILERMLLEEAARRNIKINDEDIDRYLDEVAKRNNMTREEFAQALAQQKTPMDIYRDQVRLEILRSRITSSYIRSVAAVTEEEIDAFIKEGFAASSAGPASGQQIHLRQIFWPADRHSADEARTLAESVRVKLDDGESFTDLATQYSQGPAAQNGGDMGLVPVKDLSPEIFDSTVTLSEGEVSHLVTSPRGFHLFQVVERVEPTTDDADSVPEVSKELRAQIRQKLEQEKMQAKTISFIETELPRMHTVDRRL